MRGQRPEKRRDGARARRPSVGQEGPKVIAYRRAERSDADAIALLHTRSWRESYRGEFLDTFLD
jgi:hypothetical protein